ncbi:MAG: DUF4870 domain-containing protein [Bacilli bacterium]|nr:DUF4870 domain-containing protein [Bacilli bacterium]MDD4795458.1 DUF4870 domain-containing protein [Bacilli bacterium]
MSKTKDAHKSSIGEMDANKMAVITYIGGGVFGFIPGLYYFSWVVPLVIYILEKKSKFVKKNALQSLSLQIVSSVILFILYFIVGGIIKKSYSGNPLSYLSGVYTGHSFISDLATIVSVIFAVVVIIAMIKAYNYQEYTIPLIGKFTKVLKKNLDKIVDNTKDGRK